ncbi:hexose carrier protein [Penicillium macrosclerotiorum]|uniref:hexose carrier protein n=1 Tax=Penicillium macrosclerotiorum TaxID=303699 RepID=UPI0025472380|nr:hexose carrier protein [Penicillium macrosclerotiorum]KAJ5699105.1 hexose carrier protein [Penicillium macrosclerotiorum]
MTPESPRWLVLRDRSCEAKPIIVRLIDMPEASEVVQRNLQDIIDTVQHSKNFNGPAWQSSSVAVIHRPFIASSLALVHHSCNKLDELISRMALILAVVDFVSFAFWTLLGAFLLDRVERKRVFLIGAIGQAICFGMAALGIGIGTKPMNAFAIAFIFTFYIFQVCVFFAPHDLFFPVNFLKSISLNIGNIILSHILHLSL